MKYVILTILVVAIALVQASFLSALSLFSRDINIVYILVFSYYIYRQDKFALFLCFFAGVSLDLFLFNQIGVTSANIFISILVYLVIEQFVPAEKAGKIIAVLSSSLVFSLMSYITLNFQSSSSFSGIIFSIPWALVNGCIILLISSVFVLVPWLKKDEKIKLQ